MQNAETLAFGCRCIGSMHAGLARSGPGRIGRAINVFDTTVNIRTDAGELLVVALGSTRAPMNLNVNSGSPDGTGFRNAIRANTEAATIAINGRAAVAVDRAIISLDGCDTFQNSLRQPSAGSLHAFTGRIDAIYSALHDEAQERVGCLLNPDVTTRGLLPAFLGELARGKAASGISKALAGLCGRGPGFTPAGDDFIAGYLAMSNWLGSAWHGLPIIPGSDFLRLTTWTSFKLMEYSARGLLDDQAQSMVNSVAAGDVEGYIRCIKQMGKKGHTSGLDFATGASVGLCAAADRLCGTEALDGIAGLAGRL